MGKLGLIRGAWNGLTSLFGKSEGLGKVGTALKGGLKWGGGALGLGIAAVGLDKAVTGGRLTGGSVGDNAADIGSAVGGVPAEIGANTGWASIGHNFFNAIGFIGIVLKALGVEGGWVDSLVSLQARGKELVRHPDPSTKAGGAPEIAGRSDTGASNNGPGWGSAAALAVGGAAGYGGYRALKGAGATVAATTTTAANIADDVPGLVGDKAASAPKPTHSSILGPNGKPMPYANAADDAARGAASVADDVARGAASAAKGASVWSRVASTLKDVPYVGKFFKIAAIGGTIGAAGTALMTSDAEAATTPTPGSTASPATTAAADSAGSLHTAAADAAGLGLSILGTGTAMRAAAPAAAALGMQVAPAAASLTVRGIGRMIPGVGALFAAGEGIMETASHALKGDWTKAGLSLASGAVQTVAGIGGFFTFAAGQAGAEAIRAGGIAAFGEENAIKHSLVGQVAELTGVFSDAHDNRSAPAARTPAPGLSFQPALG